MYAGLMLIRNLTEERSTFRCLMLNKLTIDAMRGYKHFAGALALRPRTGPVLLSLSAPAHGHLYQLYYRGQIGTHTLYRRRRYRNRQYKSRNEVACSLVYSGAGAVLRTLQTQPALPARGQM